MLVRNEAVTLISTHLNVYGIDVAVDPNNFTFEGDFIYEATNVRDVSDALVNAMAPRLGRTTVYHYTRLDHFKRIATEGLFKLDKLSHRLPQHEYTTFAMLHGLKGATANPGALTDAIYFGSFSEPGNHDEARMWAGEFGDDSKGVRLKLTLDPRGNAALRKISYGAQSTMLSELNETLMKEVGKRFFPRSVWTLSAFYLPGSLQQEGEIRLLVPDVANSPNPVDADRWPITLDDADSVCGMTVESVEIGWRLEPQRVSKARDIAASQGWPVSMAAEPAS